MDSTQLESLMDLVQSRAAESPSLSPSIIRQKHSKSASCGTCGLGRTPQHDPEGKGYPLRRHINDLVASGEDCRACEGISEFLRGRRSTPTLSMPLKLDFIRGSVYTRTWMSPELQVFDGRLELKTYEIFTANIGSNHEERKSTEEPAPFPDSGMIWRMRAPSGDTSSMEAFDTLKRWIYRCKEEHTLCWPANDKSLPHRVLKIDSIQPLCVQLVEDYPRRESYACLSHRWGPQTESKSLKTYNLALYKQEVPEENFYPLMKDAIEAAFRLDLRFIWIDCYCIIQDDIKDWEIAAAEMGSIYENAFLTFSATFSEGGSSMFSTISQPCAGIQVTEIEGEPVFLRQRLKHPCYLDFREGDFLDGPLLRRGWVFQERLLSNRFVHFAQDEIFWECREGTWCECASRELAFKRRREQGPRTLQTQDWGDISLQYSQTELTLEKDRLPALAGIARRYGESHGLTYLAGIWKEELPGALMWQALMPRPKPLEHVAPTWSWLSLPATSTPLFDSSTPFFDYLGQRGCSRYRFLGCNAQSQDADVYAGADRLEIMVEAPVLDLKIYNKADVGHVVGRSGNVFLLIRKDFEFDPEDPTKYRSVPEGSSCLLLIIYSPSKPQAFDDDSIQGIMLLKVDSTEGDAMKYERIGYYNGGGTCCHYVDDLNEFADYCGGSCPELHKKLIRLGRSYDGCIRKRDGTSHDARLWEILERAETRQVTII